MAFSKPDQAMQGLSSGADSPAPARGNQWAAPDMPQEAPRTRTGPRRAAPGKGSAAKGARGERDVLTTFRETMRKVEQGLSDEGHVFVARSEFTTRKRIERGTSNRDIGNVPIISIEVKRNETLNVNAAWEQCVRQADAGLLPALVYRYNREAWRVRTWAALTHYDGSGSVVRYAIAEVSLVDFLDYYAKLYRSFLTMGLQ